MEAKTRGWAVPRRTDQQWIEERDGREVTVTSHPVRAERVEFLNEPVDPATGPLTLKFYLGPGHIVNVHTYPEKTETLTVNEGRVRATATAKNESWAWAATCASTRAYRTGTRCSATRRSPSH